MRDGIYYVVFRSNQNDIGNGTVVVRDQSVNGGDFGFTYQGTVGGNTLALHVFQHDPAAQNVFHGVNEYTINLNIQESPNGYELEGAVSGMPNAHLVVHAKRIGDLV
ncbi:negative regulator GrlR [Cronobacter muytjensii]|nr:negative regulator GrlR [Cronobacter muytjensii]